MKKNILIIFLFGYTAGISYAQNSFHIQGNYTGDSAKFIAISFLDANGKWIQDTGNIINHQFAFEGNIEEPTYAFLQGKVASRSVDDPNFTEIFIEPKNIKIDVQENHFKSVKVYGSAMQNQYDSLKNTEAPIYAQIAPLDSEAEKLADSIGFFLKRNDTVSAQRMVDKRDNIIHVDMKPYRDELSNIDKQFINNNPASYLSAYLLNLQFQVYHLANDSVWFYFNKFPANVQNSYWGKDTKKWLNDIVPLGSVFPNIKGTDFGGNDISVSNSLNNNDYTLVIFWASWCIPCRQLNPTYAKIYKEYHSKGLKFIAITEDDNEKNWRTAIKKDNTADWTHIFAKKYADKIDIRTKISETYGLIYIPSEMLLKGNKVIAKYRGADNDKSSVDDLENKLKEIFK